MHRLEEKGISMKRYLYIFCCLILLFGKIECYGKEKEENPGTLYANAAVLMDGDSGRVLYEKNGQEFMANASTTKIMTCILALEKGNVEDIVTVSSYAASMPDVQLHIREGEQYRLGDLLYSLMLESHNDVAVAVAEHVSGSCEDFAKLMNQKAKEIGCKNTLFLTPNGLDATILDKAEEKDNFHGTTAVDLACIMRYCVEISPMKEKFVEITSTPSYSFGDVSGNRSFICNNHNSLFNMMDGVISGKTGFTSKAGYCYVGAVEQEGKTYIVALLACGWPGNKNYKWRDCETLISYGVSEYELVNLEERKEKLQQEMRVQVENARRGEIKEQVWVNMVSRVKEFETMLLRKDEELAVKIVKNKLEAPVDEGEKVGECIFYIDGEVWHKEPLYSGDKIEKIDLLCCLKIILKRIV